MKIHWMQRTLFMLTNGIGKRLFLMDIVILHIEGTVETIYKVIRLTELAVEARYDIEAVLPKKNYLHPFRRAC